MDSAGASSPSSKSAPKQCLDMCVEVTRSRFHKRVLSAIKTAFISFIDALQSAFINNIPSEDIQNLPSSSVYFIGMTFYAVLAVMFSVIFYFTFSSGQSERFVSIEAGNAICKTVYRPFTTTLMVDTDGNWEGSDSFVYSNAIYTFVFTEFEGSEADFAEFIESGLVTIDFVGESAKSFTLAENVMLWIAYQGSISRKGKKQLLRFTGSSPVVFDSAHRNFGVGDVHGNCEIIPQVAYDRGANKYRMEYPAAEYLASRDCTRNLNPSHVDFMPLFDGNSFRVEFSIDSLITAAGVNLGLISAPELNQIKGTKYEVDHKGTTYSYASFYYPRYPGMDAIVCVIISEYEYVCTVGLGGSVFGIPVFNNFGSSISIPSQCTCEESDSATEHACNTFSFLSGLVYYEWDDTATSNDSIMSLLNLALQVDISMSDINQNAFNATYDIANKLNAYRNDSFWRTNAYKFCDEAANPGTRCSLASLFIGDADHAITDFFLPLYPGACSDSFTVSREVKDKIKYNPPVVLTEIYQDCKNKDIDVINNSIGLTAGSIGAYVPVLVVIFVLVVQVWVQVTGLQSERSYKSSDKQEVLDFLALTLLLARDGKYDLMQEETSIILRLKTELGSKPLVRRFHGHEFDVQSSAEVEMTEREKSIVGIVKDRMIYKNEYIANPMYGGEKK